MIRVQGYGQVSRVTIRFCTLCRLCDLELVSELCRISCVVSQRGSGVNARVGNRVLVFILIVGPLFLAQVAKDVV
jgi:hypothetical protein